VSSDSSSDSELPPRPTLSSIGTPLSRTFFVEMNSSPSLPCQTVVQEKHLPVVLWIRDPVFFFAPESGIGFFLDPGSEIIDSQRIFLEV
jgi:hypothetical protein